MPAALRVLISVMKFSALTIWIGFVALSAENFFRPGVRDQQQMVMACQMAAREKFGVDLDAWNDHYYRDQGAYHHVLLVPRKAGEQIRFCLVKRDQRTIDSIW